MFIQIPIQISLQKSFTKTVQSQNPVLQFMSRNHKSRVIIGLRLQGQNHLHEKLRVTKTNSFTKAFDRVNIQNKFLTNSP